MQVAMWEPMAIEVPNRLRRWLDWDGQLGHWMRIEELRGDDEVTIRAELPGVDPDRDVEISCEEGVLRISAHRAERHASRNGREVHSEFRYGELERELALPSGARPEDIKARYEDGILEVTVPCEHPAHAQRTKVAIEHG